MWCSKCKLDKETKEFHKNKSHKNGYENWCITCKKEFGSKKRNKENFNTWHRENRSKYIEYEQEFRKQYLSSFSGTASKLLSAAKNRSKKKNLEFSIDLDWVKDKLKLMICEATGVPLTLEKDKKYGNKAPFRPSLDRIDSSKGYTKENTQLTCWMYNICKAHWTENEIFIMIKSLLKYKEHELKRV